MAQYNYKDLKAKVGIIDIAASLGYEVRITPGRNNTRKWTRMVRCADNKVVDSIVVSNADSKADQYFIRESSQDRGDVIAFVRNHINELDKSEGSEWKRVGNVLSQFAANPHPAAAEAYAAINSDRNGLDIQQLKAKVGVIDVAAALGYRIKAKAGIPGRSRWIEMVKGDLNNPVDTLVISNADNKSTQGFFRRTGGKGDVVALIRENLNELNHSTDPEWVRVMCVMADFANVPRPEVASLYRDINENNKVARELDAERYKVKPVEYVQVKRLLSDRGLTEETAKAFAPFICEIKDTTNDKYKGYNLGFPYSEAGDSKTVGYEIRGVKGYKAKAAGSNSSTAAWIADFAGLKGQQPNRVFCFESAFDAMAFYQRNRAEASDAVLVSVGGQMGAKQMTYLLEHYHGARFVDCFDNDAAGRVYGVNLSLLAAGVSAHVVPVKGQGVSVEYDGKTQLLPMSEANAKGMKKHFGISSGVEVRTAPSDFKDWNDVVLGNRIEPKVSPNKYAVSEKIAERKSSMKL